MKTTAASLAAGAIMLLAVSGTALNEWFVPAPYQSTAAYVETPVYLLITMANVEYARRVAARRGERFPF